MNQPLGNFIPIILNAAVPASYNPNISQTTVTGLQVGTTYYFVVRAFAILKDDSYLTDLNTLVQSNSTLTETAPTFAGVTSVSPQAGDLGFNDLTVSWPSPSLDGIWDSFLITYEPGTCAAGFSSNPSKLTVSGSGTTLAPIQGLTPETKYRVKVNSVYSLATPNIVDSNTTCLEGTTTPTAPVFDGIASAAPAAGFQGFSQVNVSWLPATGSLTSYEIDSSYEQNFSSYTPQAVSAFAPTTNVPVTGLLPNTTVYFRVLAVYSNTNVTPNVNLTSGGSEDPQRAYDSRGAGRRGGHQRGGGRAHFADGKLVSAFECGSERHGAF